MVQSELSAYYSLLSKYTYAETKANWIIVLYLEKFAEHALFTDIIAQLSLKSKRNAESWKFQNTGNSSGEDL